MHLCIADIAMFVYSIIFAIFVSVLSLGSGVRASRNVILGQIIRLFGRVENLNS